MPDGFPLNAVQGKTYDAAAPEMQPILAGLANFHVPPPGTPSVAETLELEGPNVRRPASPFPSANAWAREPFA